MSYPSFSVGEVLTAADMNAVGLWRVSSCTVTSTGGTAATASNGVINVGTSNTTITVSNAFSATYDAYKILGTGISCSGGTLLSFGLNGVTTGYYGNLIYANFASGAPASLGWNNAGSISHIGGGNGNTLNFQVDVVNPFLTRTTFIYSDFIDGANAGRVIAQAPTTSVTGFNIGLNQMTGGKIIVYGYRL
jgi:hypothetical protein